MGTICCVFQLMECTICGNMAPHTNENHILFYYMDVYSSIMLGHSYLNIALTAAENKVNVIFF